MRKQVTWPAPIIRLSPAVSPANFPQPEDQILFVSDKGFRLHGEILMLVLVVAFSIFLVLLVALPFLKRSVSDSESGVTESSSIQQTHFSFAFPWLRKAAAASGECQLQSSNEIGRLNSTV